MNKWKCTICHYEYDPAVGIPELGIQPGTPFKDLPKDFACPRCKMDRDAFAEKKQGE